MRLAEDDGITATRIGDRAVNASAAAISDDNDDISVAEMMRSREQWKGRSGDIVATLVVLGTCDDVLEAGGSGFCGLSPVARG